MANQPVNRRVVVTGVGLVCGLGIGTEEVWNNLHAAKSGIGPITHFDPTGFDCRIAGEVKNFEPLNWLEKKEFKKTGRFIQLALAAADFAMKQSELNVTPENRRIRRRLHRLRHRRVRRHRTRTLQICWPAAPEKFRHFLFPPPLSISLPATFPFATAPKVRTPPPPRPAPPARTPSAMRSK